jgi:protein gp37
MSAKSSIEWTEQTWNPVAGCTKISPGCKHCYAEKMAIRLQTMGVKGYEYGFKLSLVHDRLEQSLKRKVLDVPASRGHRSGCGTVANK